MSYLFPFRLIKQGSKIVLYGAGKVGKDFYFQLRDTNWVELLAWVDKGFYDYQLKYPFDYIDNINKYEADYYVIAIEDYYVAKNVRQFLLEKHVDDKKIIWSLGEYTKGNMFPTNRYKYLVCLDQYMDLIDSYLDVENGFGGHAVNGFYESNLELGLEGLRSTEERMVVYHVNEYVNQKTRALDIGCNSGFFALSVAPYVKEIVGVELEKEQIDVALKAQQLMGVNNAKFVSCDFLKYETNERYDVIFSLAVHEYMINNEKEMIVYANKLWNLF